MPKPYQTFWLNTFPVSYTHLDVYKRQKQHNDANICSIPARFVSDEEVIAIVDSYLNASFEGGRHARRIEKIPLKNI